MSRRFTAGERRRFAAGRATVGGRVARGAPVLLLTTIGRRSGLARTTPLLFHRRDDGTLLLVAANGGVDWEPDWLLNLRATPAVQVDLGDGDGAVDGRATELTPDERSAAWDEACAAFPTLAGAQRATNRRAVSLVRIEHPAYHADRC